MFEKLDEKGISNLVATLMLIAAALIGGGLTYTAFQTQANSLTSNVNVQVKSLSLKKAGGTAVATATFHNTGTVNLDSVQLTISADSDIHLNVSELGAGQSAGAENTEFDSSSVTVGETYPVVIDVTAADGSTLKKSMTVTCHST